MKSIKTKMLVSILSAVLIIFTFIIGFITCNSYKMEKIQALKYAKSETDKHSELVQGQIEGVLSAARSLSNTLQSIKENGSIDRKVTSKLLRTTLDKNENIVGVWAVWEPNALDGKDKEYINTKEKIKDGRATFYWHRTTGKTIFEPAENTYDNTDGTGVWYQTSKNSKRAAVLEPHTYKIQGKNIMMVCVTVPIISNNKVLGVLGLDVPLNTLQQVVSKMSLYETGYSQLVTKKGLIIGHKNKEYLEKNIFSKYKNKELEKVVQNAEEFQIDSISCSGEKKSLMTISPITFTGTNNSWCFITSIPNNEIFKEIKQDIIVSIFATFIGLIALAVLILNISQSISKPITVLSQIIERLSNYDLTISENSEIASCLKRKDEIGNITKSLKTMKDNLIFLIKNISDSSQQVASSSEELTATSQQSLIASGEVAKTIEEISNSANQQAKDTEEGVLYIEDLSEKIELNRQNVIKLNNTADEVALLKDEGTEIIKELNETTKINNQGANEIYDIIVGTNESAKKIETASEMIKSIAEQTNLLALNAAIEAARAGETGKGFAVVAEEIRKLAEQSNQFTEEISAVIGELTSKTKNAVGTIENLGNIVVSQTESVKMTNDKFKGIANAIEDMRKAIQLINESEKEMEDKKDEIIKIIQNLSAISEENAAGTEEASASVEQQTASMEQISNASEILAKLAEELQEGISKFKY